MPATTEPTEAPPAGGPLAALRGLADGLLGAVRERLELFSLELQEEKLRFFQALIWLSATIFAAMLVIVFASLTLVYLFWETARVQVLAGLTALYLAAFLLLLQRGRRAMRERSRPFAATLAELGEDRACIPPKS